MTNYMEDVAKMLGVEIGEIFTINDGAQYYFDCNGLNCRGYTGTSSIMLEQLLTGELSITRQPWKPSYKETFYFVAQNGIIISNMWYEHAFDVMAYKLGNCYYSKEEAEENRDKWIAFYESDEVLEV